MVGEDDLGRRAEEVDLPEDAAPDFRVGPHHLPFLLGEGSRFQEHPVGDADLPHVVEQRPAPDDVQLVFPGDPHLSRQPQRVVGHPLGMDAGGMLPHVKGRRQRQKGVVVGRLDVPEISLLLLEDARRERPHEPEHRDLANAFHLSRDTRRPGTPREHDAGQRGHRRADRRPSAAEPSRTEQDGEEVEFSDQLPGPEPFRRMLGKGQERHGDRRDQDAYRHPASHRAAESEDRLVPLELGHGRHLIAIPRVR
jgi:hypothetical protein